MKEKLYIETNIRSLYSYLEDLRIGTLQIPAFQRVHISVIPTQRFRSYPPSVFTDTWLSFANLLFLSQTLSFNIKTM